MKFKSYNELELHLIQMPVLFHLMNLDEVIEPFDELLRLAKTRGIIPSGQMTLDNDELKSLERSMFKDFEDTYKERVDYYPNLVVMKPGLLNGIISMKVTTRTVEIVDTDVPVYVNIDIKLFGENILIEKKHPQKGLQFVQDLLDNSLNELYYLGRWEKKERQPFTQEYEALAKLVVNLRRSGVSCIGDEDKVSQYLVGYTQATLLDANLQKYCDKLKCQWDGEFPYKLVTAYYWYLKEQMQRKQLHDYIVSFENFCRKRVYADSDWQLIANGGIEFNPMFFDQKAAAIVNSHETDWSITDHNIIKPSMQPSSRTDDDDTNGGFRSPNELIIAFPTMEDFWVEWLKKQ